jgi:hypothetical protein
MELKYPRLETIIIILNPFLNIFKENELLVHNPRRIFREGVEMSNIVLAD